MTVSLFSLVRIIPANPFMDEVKEFDHAFWDKLIEDYA